MKSLLGKIWRVLFFVNFGLTLTLLFPFFYFLLQKRSWYPAVHKLKRIWSRLIMWNVGITYKVEQEEQLDDHTYIFCPNHTSYLDVIASYVAIPTYFHYMAKLELANAPLFGIFFRKMDIAFDRKSIKAAHKAFQRASSDIDQGISIAMFPEGTISTNAPQMLKFKNGPFKLAIEKQIPIVPITFKNNWKILPDSDNSNEGWPGKAHIVLHKPIPTLGMTEDNIEELKAQVYGVIASELGIKDNSSVIA